MSYRKIDTEIAQKLMGQIHDLPDFEAILIWYDRFLTAGEEFNQAILEAIDNSAAFTMVITPNITTKRDGGQDNFVVAYEYPHAKEQNRPIVPVQLESGICNLKQLRLAFDNIVEPITLGEAHVLFHEAMPTIPSATSYTTERLYYLGRAYLYITTKVISTKCWNYAIKL